MNDVSRSPVLVNLRDVRGNTITDQVELKFYNQRAPSLNQMFTVQFQGLAATLPGAPAFPFGLAEVFVDPLKYRYKSIFINVPAGSPGLIDETFFVEPGHVKPVFPDFARIQSAPQNCYGFYRTPVLAPRPIGATRASWATSRRRVC